MANVTVPPFDTAPQTVVGATPQSVFSFGFPFWAAADIIVLIDNVELSTSAYTVAGAFIQNGDAVEGGYGSGTVTLNTPVTNVTVTLDRFVVASRESQFSRSSPLAMPSLNSDLNKQTARDQDMRRQIVGIGDAATAAALAAAEEVLSARVSVAEAQAFTNDEKIQGRANIGAADGASTISAAVSQAFNAAQRLKARQNMDAAPRNKATYAVDHGVVADGSTDDKAAMQAAYAAAADLQGVSDLVLPSGVIYVVGTLDWDRGQVSIRGTGQGSTIIRQGQSATDCILIRKATSGYLFNVTVEGITVDIAAGVDTTVSGVGIKAEAIINLTMTDVVVSGFKANLVLAGCFDTSGHNCDFIGSATVAAGRVGLYITKGSASYGNTYGGNIKFTSSEGRTSSGLSGTPGLGRCLVIDACDGLFFDGCYFGYAEIAAVELNKAGTLIAGVTFTNCWFDAYEGTNVIFSGMGVANGETKFTGCTWVGGTTVDRNLSFGGDWTNLIVTGGSMKWCLVDNIYLGPATSRITIKGIQIALANYDGVSGGEGVFSDGASFVHLDVDIDGLGYTGNGVHVKAGRCVRVVGTITGCENAVYTEGDLDYYRIDVVAYANDNTPQVLDAATGVHKLVSAGAW
ncbi:hypothetical protein BH10PSE1_BH10PSE1_28230 [soil metagenome]